MGINNNAPKTALDVNGTITTNEKIGIGTVNPESKFQIGEMPEDLYSREVPEIDRSGMIYREMDSIPSPVVVQCSSRVCLDEAVAKFDENSFSFLREKKSGESYHARSSFSYYNFSTPVLDISETVWGNSLYEMSMLRATSDCISISKEKIGVGNYSVHTSTMKPGQLQLDHGWGDWLELGNCDGGFWKIHNPKTHDQLEFGYKTGFGDAGPHLWGILCLHNDGNVSIGKTSADAKLDVEGDIKSSGSVIANNFKVGNWIIEAPDYVFDAETYDLKSLAYVKKFIEKEKRLPGVPSASMMKKDGVDLAEMSMTLLKKVEEMQLYILQQQEKIEKLEKDMKEIKR